MRLPRTSPLLCSVVLIVALAMAPGVASAREARGGPLAKLAPELQRLYAAYRTSQQTGAPFVSEDPLIPVVDGLVTIDAVASGDVDDLRRDLIALGLQNPATAGRLVSGRFPVSALEALAGLPTLRFARAAMAIRHDGQGQGIRR